MYASTSFTSHLVIHDLLVDSHTRRLLLQSFPPPAAAAAAATNSHNATDLYLGGTTFDANVVMILSVLLCAVIVSLGLNSIIRCALRCSDLVISGDPSSSAAANPSPRLANKGIKKKALKTFPIINYSAESKVVGLDTECIICLSEFGNGEKVRVLPKCNHGFHVRCIDTWLTAHSSCPKCRQCLLHTCHKIVGSQQPAQVLPLPETVITIQPLEPEGLVRNYN